MNKIKELWKEFCIKGMHLPFAHDPVTGKPSVTLLFPYLTFVITVISIIALHFKPSLVFATSMCIIFWALSVVFYMLRKLSKAKFDLDNKSLELDSGEKNDR